MSAEKGIRTFGYKAIQVVLIKLSQLDEKGMVEPLDTDKISFQQKKDALRTVSFFKQKRRGRLKSRTCADGSKQRPYITKEGSSLPTVSTEALVATLVIDANEDRDVATSDVVGAYLNADMEKFVAMKIEGMTIDIMVKSDPGKYSSHAHTQNSKKVLCVKIAKALYGCIKSGLLLYNLFSETLRKIAFVLNTYDLCVANKDVHGKNILLRGTSTT